MVTSVEYTTASYLKTPEDMAAYLNAVLEENDSELLVLALRNIAEARGGIEKLAETSGAGFESLSGNLADQDNPRIKNLSELLRALGLRLTVEIDREHI